MENLKSTETLNTLIFVLCIVPLSLMHETRIDVNVKKLSRGVRVPAAKAERSGVQQRLERASSFPACCPASKGQCEGQADKCT